MAHSMVRPTTTYEEIRQAEASLQTINDYLRWTISTFSNHQLWYGHGTDNAVDEAYHLILSALTLPFDLDPALLLGRLTEMEKAHLTSALSQRILERVPVPYITGTALFYGEPFIVTSDVLIPRSSLGEIISAPDQYLPSLPPQAAILDLCAGSGALAVLCAKQWSEAQIDAAELCPKALAVAKENCQAHGLTDRIRLYQSDLFSGLPNKQYDLIITNPPYVPESSRSALPAEYSYEPESALFADQNGLSVIHRILSESAAHLSRTGWLLMEVGESESALKACYPELPFRWLAPQGEGGICLLARSALESLADR